MLPRGIAVVRSARGWCGTEGDLKLRSHPRIEALGSRVVFRPRGGESKGSPSVPGPEREEGEEPVETTQNFFVRPSRAVSGA